MDNLTPPLWEPPDGRQFVAVQFRGQARSYTYHNDGEPVAIGDLVKVECRGGIQTVEVVGLPGEPPSFETKQILGPADSQEKEYA